MDEEQLEEIIDNKLKEYKMPSFSNLKSNIKQYLLKIEEEIQLINNQKQSSLEKYKSSKINILSLSQRVNISRQTIYNNRDVLEKYIQINQQETEKEDIFNILEEKNNKINNLNEAILKFQHRDLSEQLYLDKIELLEVENKNLHRQTDILNKNNIEFVKEINELKENIRKNPQKNTVIDINNTKKE